MIVEEIKATDENPGDQQTDPEPKPTESEIKLSEELLETRAQIVKLQEQIKKKEDEAKEKAFNEILTKYKVVKPEFQRFIKSELKWQEINDLDKATLDYIKKNPGLIATSTTAGNNGQKINSDNDDGDKSNSRLVDYKNKNNL